MWNHHSYLLYFKILQYIKKINIKTYFYFYGSNIRVWKNVRSRKIDKKIMNLIVWLVRFFYKKPWNFLHILICNASKVPLVINFKTMKHYKLNLKPPNFNLFFFNLYPELPKKN